MLKVNHMRVSSYLAGLAVAGLVACEPAVKKKPSVRETGFPTPPLAPPAAPMKLDGTIRQWAAVWTEVKGRVTHLRDELRERQAIHRANHFDGWLGLDPAALSPQELVSLFEFLKRGFFTVEREAYLALLEGQVRRLGTEAVPAWRKETLKERTMASVEKAELTLVDLETALNFYRRTNEEDIYVPADLAAEELHELREACRKMQDEARTSVEKLDAEIAVKVARLGKPPQP